LRIGIDTLFETPSGTGGVTCLQNLVSALVEFDQQNEYFVFVNPLNHSLFDDIKAKNLHLVECSYPNKGRFWRVLAQQVVLPALSRRLNLDVFHAPGNVLPLAVPCASVLTVQNILNVHSFRYVSKKRVALYRCLMTRISAPRADMIIVPSRSLRCDILQHLKVPSDKVKVIRLGVNHDQFRPLPYGSIKRILSAYGIQGPYILFVSALRSYKNAHSLLQAFSYLIRKYRIKHHLVIVGDGEKSYRQFLEKVAVEENIDKRVIFAGRILHSEIQAFYAGADVCVHPSLLESFGLTVLEAMSVGVPIVVSDRAALPEIVGDAGVLADPTNPDVLAEAIFKVISDENLRSQLIQKGLERAKEFTWERTARESLKVYERAFQMWKAKKIV